MQKQIANRRGRSSRRTLSAHDPLPLPCPTQAAKRRATLALAPHSSFTRGPWERPTTTATTCERLGRPLTSTHAKTMRGVGGGEGKANGGRGSTRVLGENIRGVGGRDKRRRMVAEAVLGYSTWVEATACSRAVHALLSSPWAVWYHPGAGGALCSDCARLRFLGI